MRISSGSGKVFLVGIAAGHPRDLYNPIFEDGAFELVPEPDDPALLGAGRGRGIMASTFGRLRRYRDGLPLLSLFPRRVQARYRNLPARAELDLGHPQGDAAPTFTYGAQPFDRPDAAALRWAEVGDLLLFLTRLTPVRGRRPARRSAAYYLVGCLAVARVLEHPPGAGDVVDLATGERVAPAWYRRCAYLRRWAASPPGAQAAHFTVFEGGPGSARFERALRLDEGLVQSVLSSPSGQQHAPARRYTAALARTARVVLDLTVAADRARLLTLTERLGGDARMTLRGLAGP